MEMVWALKAHHHAETYFKVIAYSLGNSSVCDLLCYSETCIKQPPLGSALSMFLYVVQ